jgi:nucleotide-binding universal stress UspA family protein
MFKTILVGVDGRQGGQDALSLAARLASTESEIVAVRSFAFEAFPSRFGSAGYESTAAEETRDALEHDLAATPVSLARTHVIGATSPARALHAAAEAEHADLIVVGSSHHGAAGRVLVGDAAANTLHASPCAVAVAPHGAAGSPEQAPVRTIGVGFDGRDEAVHALGLAAALARELDAAIRVLSVVVLPATLAATPAFDETWIDIYREEAAENLRQALADHGDVAATGEAVVGDPVGKLTDLSRDVDLLVLGSRAWGPVRRLLTGSTAVSLTREAHCPLLILPRSAAYEAAEGREDVASTAGVEA